MNLEDRLRTHMHSGEELFVEGETSASDISAAGERRTRRNQVGGVAAAGLLCFGLVFGVANLGGSSEPELALPGEAELDATSDDFAVEEAIGPAGESELFNGPIPAFDIITGVDDGFVGLRNRDGVMSAIRTTDGISWIEQPTTGLDGAQPSSALAVSDETLAAIFDSFDEATGISRNFIGTSTDLTTWTLVEVFEGNPDVNLSGISVSNGVVVTTASVFDSPIDEEETSTGDDQGFVITGPVGGPYTEVPLEAASAGVDRIVSVGDGFAASTFATDPVLVSSDGTTWTPTSRTDPILQFASVAALDGNLLLIGSSDFETAGGFAIFESSDDGASWAPTGVPASIADDAWWSFSAVSSDEAIAVLLSGEGTTEDGALLQRHAVVASTGGGFFEVDLGPFMQPADNISLVAVSNEELLVQVFPAPDEGDESLAASSGEASSGPADEGVATGAPTYVAIPLG